MAESTEAMATLNSAFERYVAKHGRDLRPFDEVFLRSFVNELFRLLTSYDGGADIDPILEPFLEFLLTETQAMDWPKLYDIPARTVQAAAFVVTANHISFHAIKDGSSANQITPPYAEQKLTEFYMLLTTVVESAIERDSTEWITKFRTESEYLKEAFSQIFAGTPDSRRTCQKLRPGRDLRFVQLAIGIAIRSYRPGESILGADVALLMYKDRFVLREALYLATAICPSTEKGEFVKIQPETLLNSFEDILRSRNDPNAELCFGCLVPEKVGEKLFTGKKQKFLQGFDAYFDADIISPNAPEVVCGLAELVESEELGSGIEKCGPGPGGDTFCCEADASPKIKAAVEVFAKFDDDRPRFISAFKVASLMLLSDLVFGFTPPEPGIVSQRTQQLLHSWVKKAFKTGSVRKRSEVKIPSALYKTKLSVGEETCRGSDVVEWMEGLSHVVYHFSRWREDIDWYIASENISSSSPSLVPLASFINRQASGLDGLLISLLWDIVDFGSKNPNYDYDACLGANIGPVLSLEERREELQSFGPETLTKNSWSYQHWATLVSALQFADSRFRGTYQITGKDVEDIPDPVKEKMRETLQGLKNPNLMSYLAECRLMMAVGLFQNHNPPPHSILFADENFIFESLVKNRLCTHGDCSKDATYGQKGFCDGLRVATSKGHQKLVELMSRMKYRYDDTMPPNTPLVNLPKFVFNFSTGKSSEIPVSLVIRTQVENQRYCDNCDYCGDQLTHTKKQVEAKLLSKGRTCRSGGASADAESDLDCDPSTCCEHGHHYTDDEVRKQKRAKKRKDLSRYEHLPAPVRPHYEALLLEAAAQYQNGNTRAAFVLYRLFLDSPDITKVGNEEVAIIRLFLAHTIIENSFAHHSELDVAEMMLRKAENSLEPGLPLPTFLKGKLALCCKDAQKAKEYFSAVGPCLDQAMDVPALTLPRMDIGLPFTSLETIKKELPTEMLKSWNPAPPDFRCRGQGCASRNIYYGYRFMGYSTIHCSLKCLATYHPGCFKKALAETGISESRDILTGRYPCVTPDCAGVVRAIYTYRKDSLLHLKVTTNIPFGATMPKAPVDRSVDDANKADRHKLTPGPGVSPDGFRGRNAGADHRHYGGEGHCPLGASGNGLMRSPSAWSGRASAVARGAFNSAGAGSRQSWGTGAGDCPAKNQSPRAASRSVTGCCSSDFGGATSVNYGGHSENGAAEGPGGVTESGGRGASHPPGDGSDGNSDDMDPRFRTYKAKLRCLPK